MLTAIIGGSGLSELDGLTITHREVMRTKYGEPSGALVFGQLCDREVVFMNRHGPAHTIPPHLVNYRANLMSLKMAGAQQIIAVNAVGGITRNLNSIDLVIPDQILDYTYSREHTFFDSQHEPVRHIDFTYPFSEKLRASILKTAKNNGIQLVDSGTYAATQGPRFETAAEIDMMERDGATIVGMTGMPEAVLARELELDYAMIAVVSNPAAGRSEAEISVDEIMTNLQTGMARVKDLLERVIPEL